MEITVIVLQWANKIQPQGPEAPVATALLIASYISWCQEWVWSQGEQCVCFNVVLSLLGLQYKVEGIKRWLHKRHQSRIPFLLSRRAIQRPELTEMEKL